MQQLTPLPYSDIAGYTAPAMHRQDVQLSGTPLGSPSGVPNPMSGGQAPNPLLQSQAVKDMVRALMGQQNVNV